jgi:hypothetical protein
MDFEGGIVIHHDDDKGRFCYRDRPKMPNNPAVGIVDAIPISGVAGRAVSSVFGNREGPRNE